MSLDPNETNPAYRLGRLFAALEGVQRAALGKVNATIRDRFFSAASATPRARLPAARAQRTEPPEGAPRGAKRPGRLVRQGDRTDRRRSRGDRVPPQPLAGRAGPLLGRLLPTNASRLYRPQSQTTTPPVSEK